MSVRHKPPSWQSSDEAIKAVQIAFDVEEVVLETVRRVAFESNRSTSDQIRFLLGLPTSSRPKRPRLTVSLTGADYEVLATRYGLPVDDRLSIKEKVTQELVEFALGKKRRKSKKS